MLSARFKRKKFKEEKKESVKIDFPLEVFHSVTTNVLENYYLYFSTTPIAERFFTSSTSLTLKHAAWYPSEMLDPHIVLLTSDNIIR
jgi:hypothetical protein